MGPLLVVGGILTVWLLSGVTQFGVVKKSHKHSCMNMSFQSGCAFRNVQCYIIYNLWFLHKLLFCSNHKLLLLFFYQPKYHKLHINITVLCTRYSKLQQYVTNSQNWDIVEYRFHGYFSPGSICFFVVHII